MKKVFLFIVFLYLIGYSILYSQSKRNYDVLKYDLSVDWVDILLSQKGEIDKRQWNGIMKITLTPLVDSLTEIELDAVKLKINAINFSIFRNGNDFFTAALSGYSGTTDDKLIIYPFVSPPVPVSMKIGDTVILQIYYTYNNPYNQGFSYRNSADTYPDNYKFDIDAPSAGNLNEPEDARYWFPCNDVPDDKALLSISATVPFGMKAASNGLLDSNVVKENNETFYWSSKHTLPPYLITIVAANYDLHIERMQINSTETAHPDSIDVYYYTFPGDWDGENGYTAKRNLSTTQKTLQIYSDLFGNYPFEKYGYATVDYTYLGYQSLGMEHQTLTTTNRHWVKDFIAVPGYTSFAHELAHHWFGNMVTCKNWNDVWFNEGGATWLEAIYMERINDVIDTNAYYNFMNSRRESYLKYDTLYDIPIGKLEGANALFNYSILTYSKASWLFHHLRVLLGDDVFPLFRKLLEQYKFSNISRKEFLDFWIENVPNTPYNIDIKKFIEQFIIYGGHPQYAINTDIQSENDSFIVNVNLKQTQQKTDNILDNYLMYLKIDFFDINNNLIHCEYIVNTENTQDYTFKLERMPGKIVLDSTKSLIEIIENNITNIKADNNTNVITIFPNPAIPNTEITIISDINNVDNIVIVDSYGNIIKNNLQIIEHNANKYIISIPAISSGTYFILFNGNNMYKLIVK
jgi:aminopeptidase N